MIENLVNKRFLKNQLVKNLEGIDSIENFIIAYEPIWAIGTGETLLASKYIMLIVL